jgi:hypothetical protein
MQGSAETAVGFVVAVGWWPMQKFAVSQIGTGPGFKLPHTR